MEKDLKKYPFNLLKNLFTGEEIEKLPNDSEIALEYVITETLSEREALFLRMRYKEGMTYPAIGEANKLSAGRSRQIVSMAELRLRHSSRKKHIQMGMHKFIEYVRESERAYCEMEYKCRIKELEKEIARLKHEEYIPEIPQSEILDENIEVLELSVRAYNVLCRGNLRTVRNIIEADPEYILNLRNLGRKSFLEIIDVLKDKGFEDKAMEIWRCYESRN